jgi:hypothetical protein
LSESSHLYSPDDLVSVLYPLPDDDVNDRTTWHWLPGIVLEVTEFPTIEYAVQVQDDRAAEPDPDEDCLVFAVCFRDASEIQPRRETTDDVVRVVIEAENADGDGTAAVELAASFAEYGAVIMLTLTGDGASVSAGLSVVGSRQLRAALADAEQHVERNQP